MLCGQVSGEVEIGVPACVSWELFGGIQLGEVVAKELPNIFEKVEVEGDGGVGTIIKTVIAPGIPGFTSFKEKFTKVDNEKLIKETEMIEGGFLDFGFTLCRFRFKVLNKNEDSCIIISTIEYEVREEAASNASMITIEPLTTIAEAAKNYLIKKYTKAAHPI